MSKMAIESVQSLEIWGRMLEVKVIFDCFPEEEISAAQIAAYDDFIKNPEGYLGIALSEAENYCCEHSNGQVTPPVTNIFKYVMPHLIYIKRSRNDKKLFSLVCKYKFDMENGLAVNFEDGKLKSTGPEQTAL